MILFKHNIISLLLIICIQISHAIVISKSDTLRISISGGASARYEEPFGFKIKKRTGVSLKAQCPLTENVYIHLSIKNNKKLFIPFVEQGYIRLLRNGFTASFGMLLNRYGKSKLYRSASVYNPLFENSVLWDASGIGIRLDKKIKKVLFQGGVTVDKEKCSSYHLLHRVKIKHFKSIILCGVQLSPSQKKVDCFTIGSELFFNHRRVRLHTVITYDYTRHFGLPVNDKNKSARINSGFFEARFRISSNLDINMLSFYKYRRKYNSHKSIYDGIVAELIIHKWFGVGYGFEYKLKKEVITKSPEIFLLLRPIQDHVSLKLSFQTGRTKDLSWPYKWKGSVWFEF